jgi:hypothetical protein
VLVAALACWASTAHAQWTRHHGSECLPANADEVSDHAITSWGSANTSVDHVVLLACPSDDTDRYPDSTAGEVRVYVYDASPTDTVRARICLAYRTATGGTCSAWRSTAVGAVGGAVITLSGADLDLWKQGTDIGRLEVLLPKREGLTGYSYLKGWVTQP